MSDPTIFTGANGESRVKGEEIVCPVVVGTVAWFLGKKATEFASHKWTVYLRGAKGQDLSYCIKKVIFQLHPSFNEPTRTVERQPFELTEQGWGEFEIVATLVFHDDVCEKDLNLVHKLRLYADSEAVPQSTKRPVVSEQYEEIIFNEPAENFWKRVGEHGLNPAPDPQLSVLPYISRFDPQEDLRRLHTAQQRVAMMHKGQLAQSSAGVTA